MHCRNCGSEVAPAASVCLNCGAAQQGAGHATTTAAPPSPASSGFCRSCGTELQQGAAVCLSCGASAGPTAALASVAGSKNPWIAALLSFLIVGAGQLYIGDNMGKAIAFLIGGFVLFVLGFLTLVLLIPALALWGFNIYDAYTGTQKWNVQRGFAAEG